MKHFVEMWNVENFWIRTVSVELRAIHSEEALRFHKISTPGN